MFPDQRAGPAASLRARLLAASRPAVRRRGLGLFATLAILAHLLLVGSLVALPRAFGLFSRPPPAPPPEPATVALIMQDTPTVGGSRPSTPRPAASPAAARTPSPAPPTPTPLTSPNAADQLSVSSRAAGTPSATPSRSTAAPTQSQAAIASAEVNLDSDDAPGTGIVSGDNVVPARPDDRQKNIPPIYPVAAEERGEAGSVVLVVTVAPDGHASQVEIASSSGHPILDDEARRAVSRWHFRPAIRGGKPVESFFNEEIDFDGRVRR